MCARPRKSSLRPNKITACHTGLGRGRSVWCLKASLGPLLLVLFRSGDRVGEGPGNEVESMYVRGMKTASVAYSVADIETRKGARKKGRLGREIEDKGSECRIVRVGVFLNRNVHNSDWRFDNMCGSDVKSVTAGLHPAPGAIRHGLLMTRLLGSNHSLCHVTP